MEPPDTHPGFEVTFLVTESLFLDQMEDWEEALPSVAERARNDRRDVRLLILIVVLAALCVGVATAAVLGWNPQTSVIPWALGVVLAIFSGWCSLAIPTSTGRILARGRDIIRCAGPQSDLGNWSVELSEEGVARVTPLSTASFLWKRFAGAYASRRFVFLEMDGEMTIFVPKDAFRTPADCTAFWEYARARIPDDADKAP